MIVKKQFASTKYLSVFLVSFATALMLSGCGGEPGVALELVTGTVTEGGKPLAGAIVEFFPSAGRTSVGQTDAEGAFTMRYGDVDGVVIGACKVQITPGLLAPEGDEGSDMVAPPMQKPPEVIMVSNGVTVEDGGANTFAFELDDYRKPSKK